MTQNQFFDRQGTTLRYRLDGADDGPAVVFANSLGTRLEMWDAVVAELPTSLKLVRVDKRGHGLSSVPASPYSMGTLVRDHEALIDHLGLKDVVFVGLSIGGMIAQGLAVKRLDLIRALVLSNTGAKLGTAELWQTRIDELNARGLEHMQDAVMERWFSAAKAHSDLSKPWRKMLLETPLEGYIGCCHAIKGTDFFSPTSGLRCPCLAIAGNEDSATPADLVRETAGLIPGSRFELMRGVGHLPPIEEPKAYAALLTEFMTEIGHLP